MREDIGRALSGGVDRETNILSTLASLGLGYLAQLGLEQDQEDFLHRGRYERTPDARGSRNGTRTPVFRPPRGGVPSASPRCAAPASPTAPG